MPPIQEENSPEEVQGDMDSAPRHDANMTADLAGEVLAGKIPYQGGYGIHSSPSLHHGPREVDSQLKLPTQCPDMQCLGPPARDASVAITSHIVLAPSCGGQAMSCQDSDATCASNASCTDEVKRFCAQRTQVDFTMAMAEFVQIPTDNLRRQASCCLS